MQNKGEDRSALREMAVSIGKRAAQWAIVTVGFFAWWMMMLLLISLILVNRWHVSFEEIILYSLILTAVCSFGYLILMNERRKRRRNGF